MKYPINDGSRPSRLDLARHASGEQLLPPEKADPQRLSLLEAERARTPEFDWTILQAAAHRVEEPPRPAPRNAAFRWWWMPVFAVLSLLLVWKIPVHENRLKGETSLGFYVLRTGQVYPGDPAVSYHAGDRIQFTYHAGTSSRMVLLSVDGAGQLTTFYPSSGDTPVDVIPGETHVLDGSIRLDDAPGPEVFLAFFDVDSVKEAEEAALQAWTNNGTAGLQALAQEDPEIAVLTLERR